MDSESFRRYCLAFPQATENLQWGDDLCFKLRGKIFATLALSTVPQKMCFKCTPEIFSELVEREGIVPAPYVGRYKWVMVEGFEVLRDREWEDLIRQSYKMVAAKAPKKSMASSRKTRKR